MTAIALATGPVSRAESLRPAAALQLPSAEQVAGRLAQVIAEVLVRARPAVQLEAYAVTTVVRLLERRADAPRLATGGGVPRPVMKSIRVSTPGPGAAEVCAVIAIGERHRALAFRIERSERGWVCVAAQVG